MYEIEIDELCRNHFQLLKELELEKLGFNYEVIKRHVINLIQSVEAADSQITIDELNDELTALFEKFNLCDWKRILLFDAITIDITTQYRLWLGIQDCNCCNTKSTQMIVINKHASVEDKIRFLVSRRDQETSCQAK